LIFNGLHGVISPGDRTLQTYVKPTIFLKCAYFIGVVFAAEEGSVKVFNCHTFSAISLVFAASRRQNTTIHLSAKFTERN
jgi:hypothetical protein